jgi:hypothetical protein
MALCLLDYFGLSILNEPKHNGNIDVSDDPEFESNSPDMEQVAEMWRTCFRALFGNKIKDIFKIAKKIKEFHDEYNRDPAIWQASWNVVCKQIIGISYAAVSQYEKIHEVFSSPVLAGYQDIWPARTYTLYLIARAFEVHDRTVFKALEGALEGKGTISPAMEQKEAKQLLDLAEKDADVKGPDFLYGERKKPTRAKPKTYAKYDRPEETAEEAEVRAQLEIPGLDPLSEATIKAELTARAKIEESDHCYLALREELQEYGKEIEEDVLRHVLIARVNHPSLFKRIADFDSHYDQMAVTMALRRLGYS